MLCQLEYYKDSGKYYSNGEINVDEETFWGAVERVVAMLNEGIRPGLINGKEFHALITVFTEFGPLTWLYIRK